MAVDTPVLERTNEKLKRECAVPSRLEYLEEDEHNARIRSTYQRLINPEYKIDDVLPQQPVQEVAAAEETAVITEQPYRVESARVQSALFRADSTVNRVEAVAEAEEEKLAEVVTDVKEEENEDLMPTPTTIQYQTVGKQEEKKIQSVTDKRSHVFGKREKIILAVFVAVVVALLALVIINSAVITNLNAEIARVQNGITTVRGALVGVNSDMEGLIQSVLGQ